MSGKDVVASMVHQAAKMGGRLEKLEVGKLLFEELNGEFAKEGEPLVVLGVPIHLMSARDEMLNAVQNYAYLRWDTRMTMDDVRSLLKAVPDDEIGSLGPLIVDQHLDDHGYDDPVEEMDAGDVKNLKERIAELGFEVEI